MIIIQTVPSGSVGPLNSVAGTITTVGQVPDDTDFLAQAFVDANLAVIKLPLDYQPPGGMAYLIGGYVTPRSAGLLPSDTYTDTAAFEADAALTPEKYRGLGSYVFYNGTSYVLNDPTRSLGEISTLTITNAGNGYAIGSNIATSTITGDGVGLEVEITSVGGNGEITGVAVDESGAGYDVNDTVTVLGAAGNAVLTIGALVEEKVGEINIGRGKANQAGPNDMNPAYFTETPYGLTPQELELFIPSSSQVISYDGTLPAPYTYDSFGDCFVGGDFRVQIRSVGSTDVISEIVCPGPQEVNSDVELPKYLP